MVGYMKFDVNRFFGTFESRPKITIGTTYKFGYELLKNRDFVGGILDPPGVPRHLVSQLNSRDKLFVMRR